MSEDALRHGHDAGRGTPSATFRMSRPSRTAAVRARDRTRWAYRTVAGASPSSVKAVHPEVRVSDPRQGHLGADYTGKSCRLALRCLGRRSPVVQRCGEMATASVRARTGLRTTSTASRAGLSPSRCRPLHRRGGRCVDDESPRRRPGERPYLGRHRRQRPRPHGITGPNRCRAVPPGSRAWPWPLLAAPPVWRVARLPSESARGRPRGRR